MLLLYFLYHHVFRNKDDIEIIFSLLFCDGGCSLAVNGSLFVHAEIFAGLTIKL